MDIAKKSQDQLARIKLNVHRAHDYFKPNYDRYNEFRSFVFDSSLKEEEVTLLATLSRPQIEFNVLEAYISRLLGEFSKQEPDILVESDDQTKMQPAMLDLLEQHLRHVLADSNNQHTKYEVYKDLLSGGFSVLKVMTDYAHPMSMNQVIKIERAYDPTLCGFDQLARFSHKGDGRFCFELFPMTKDEFEEKYPDVPTNLLNFRRDFAGFSWSYLNDTTPTMIIADYYEKKEKKTRIVQLRDGKVMTTKDYDKFIAEWNDITAPPAIMGRPRTTTLETIFRYRCIENKIIEYVETDFTHLPLVFVDGSSLMLRTQKNGNVRQMTRPYVYHAKGAQRLKNFAGISLANEIESTVQHKFMVAKEALPKEEEFLQAYKNVQKASVLVYNQFYEENPDQPIPNAVREIQRVPAPPEMVQAFTGADQLIQNVLGSYDASLGINNNQLSGIAIVEAASQSNATAMPYIVGFLQGYQRAAQIYMDLLPKYYKTPRTLPIMDKEGKRSFIKINQPGGIELFYDTNALNVIIKAGASFQVQKSRTIMMVKEMMGMSPIFAQFIAEKGLNFVLDNMEGKGVEQLKSLVDDWLKQLEQQKQMAMQQQQQEMQNNPAVMKNKIDQQKLMLEAKKDQQDYIVEMEQLKIDEAKLVAELLAAKGQNEVQILKADTERYAKQIDLEIKHVDMQHRHAKETIETHHMINQPNREIKNEVRNN